jgi:hypothetical protein
VTKADLTAGYRGGGMIDFAINSWGSRLAQPHTILAARSISRTIFVLTIDSFVTTNETAF